MPKSYELSKTAQTAKVANEMRKSRFSVAALWSIAAENDVEVDDELAKNQKQLREIKQKISTQSKINFLLEKDVRYLDSRIALLIQNRMALSEQQEVAEKLEDFAQQEGTMDSKRKESYGNLFHLLQSEPRYVAGLTRLVSVSQIDILLQTVMFTLFGNQYEIREEYLLLSMFQNVLAAEFESASSFAGLMRANTPVSRMMTTYTRRGPGQAYLKMVLSERLNKLIALKDLDLEINPLKIYEKMHQDIADATGECQLPKVVGYNEAAQNPDVQAIITPRIKTIMEIAASFLSAILSSIDILPYGIRWICKQIRSLTKRKFPDATNSQICSLIGGFFMLRFVNPCIVSPQAYMLVDREPQTNSKRILTLLAKIMQNLSNKPSVQKELFMTALNPFVAHNEIRFQQFLNEICEVGEFNEALEMEQYIALSKKDLELHITLNEIYSTHEFLNQFKDELSTASDDKLRVCLNEVGPPPKQLPRSENRTVIIPLLSKWELTMNENSNGASDKLTEREFLYYDTKALFVQILRLSPIWAQNQPLDLVKIAEMASQGKDAQLVTKGIKAMDMLEELINCGAVSLDDGCQLMVEEISKEIEDLGDLKVKVQKEIDGLVQVYSAILNHNNYLKSQLETYKAYLQNVRVQAGGAQQTQKQASVLKFSYHKLEAESVLLESGVPENRRSNIYFVFNSPAPGNFIISIWYKGREQPILEMELKLDDLLENQQQGVKALNLEYVKFDVQKTIQLLNKHFLK